MGAMSLRNLDPKVAATLRERAEAESRSLNSLICDILTREALKLEKRARWIARRDAIDARAQAIFEEFGEGTPAEVLIREDRDR